MGGSGFGGYLSLVAEVLGVLVCWGALGASGQGLRTKNKFGVEDGGEVLEKTGFGVSG